MNKNKLIVTAGGTGGHIFPGLAVAQYLKKQGWNVRWLGTAEHMEAILIPKHGIKIDFIRINGLRGKGIKAQFLAPINIFNAWIQARNVMKTWKPNIVLGMGGYVSGPGILAAWSHGIPIVLHEQNTIPGLTNKWLAKIANKVTQGFPNAFPNAIVVGNPIQKHLVNLPLPNERLLNRIGPIRILVVGGSQGAHILNRTLPKVVKKLNEKITIWHQTGKKALLEVKLEYKKIGQSQHKVTEFIENMAEAYSWADLIICRAGALTVSEIATVGLAAIFVPFQHKDRQQYWNASLLEKAGAAKILEQPYFTTKAIIEILSNWNRTTLLTMAMKAKKVSILNATERVAQEIIKTVKDVL